MRIIYNAHLISNIKRILILGANLSFGNTSVLTQFNADIINKICLRIVAALGTDMTKFI